MPKPPTIHSRLFSGRPATLFLLLSFFVLHGCAVAVIGIGAGAGAFAYLNGKLTRTYESEYHETVRVSKATLQKLKIPVTETVADELKTEIRGKRADGTPVTVEVIRVDRRHNEVAVRTGKVGVWDRRASEQIHGYIDGALGGKVVVPEKSSEEQATEAAPPATAKPQITEEDLAGTSTAAAAPVRPATGADSGHSDLEQKRLRAAQMLENSDFHIFFDKDSNVLSPKSMQKLDRIYGIVSQNAAARLTLNGYTDSWGKPSYNQMVSELRANAVKSYLVGKGLNPSRMTAVGHGADNAIAPNKTAEGRSMNRRVEIEITTTQ